MLGHNNKNSWLCNTARASIRVGLRRWMIPWFLDEVAADQEAAQEALHTKELVAQTFVDLNVLMIVSQRLAVYSFITAC